VTPPPRIISKTIYYNDPPEMLEQLIKSMRGIVDTAVFLDGAYKHFPHRGNPCSNREQRDAIIETCQQWNLPCLMVPGSQYENQCHKRTHAFKIVEQIGIPYVDYCLVIDADEHIVKPPTIQQLRRAMRNNGAGFDVGLVAITTTPPTGKVNRNLKGIHNPDRSTGGLVHHDFPRLFRIHRNTTVGPTHHWVYIAETQHGKTIALKGSRRIRTDCLPTIADLTHILKLENKTWHRGPERLAAKHAYGLKREALGEDL